MDLGVIVINNHNGFCFEIIVSSNKWKLFHLFHHFPTISFYFHIFPFLPLTFPFSLQLPLSLLLQQNSSLSLSPQRHTQGLLKNITFFSKKLPKVTHYQSQLISFIFFFILILNLWIFHLGHGWTVSEPRSRRRSVVILEFSSLRASLLPIERIKVSFPLFSCSVFKFEGNIRVEM